MARTILQALASNERISKRNDNSPPEKESRSRRNCLDAGNASRTAKRMAAAPKWVSGNGSFVVSTLFAKAAFGRKMYRWWVRDGILQL